MVKSSKLIDLLNQALHLEYSMIIHYPRLASSVEDEDTRRLVLELGLASITHADVVARAIQELGGHPNWSIEPFLRETDLVKIFQEQLEKEKLVLKLHSQIVDLVLNWRLKDEFRNTAKEEESHIRIVEEILSRLSQQEVSD